MITGGLGFLLAYFEDMEFLGSNSGTKVWLEWPKLSKNGLHHFVLVVSPRISP